MVDVVQLRFVLFQEFKKNLKGVNGGANFDDDMLNEIFEAIR